MPSHTAQTELKFIGKLILEGNLHCETGLHIGAGKGSLEIGGADNPVVKDAFGRPYIPGSSLRGKLRSLIEQATGLAVPNELVYLSKRKGQEVRIHQSDRPDDEGVPAVRAQPGTPGTRAGRCTGYHRGDSFAPHPSTMRRWTSSPSRPRCARTWMTNLPK